MDPKLRLITRAVLVYNPAARRLRKQIDRKLRQIVAAFTAEGIHVDLAPTKGPGDAGLISKDAVLSHQLIIAYGGDGTIHEVISGMANSSVPLLVVPGGTANVLAKELGLSGDLSRAVNLVKTGLIRRISLGKTSDRYFILMAGIGVDAAVVAAFSQRMKRHFGEGAFWFAGLQQLARYSFEPFNLLVDGVPYTATFAVISRVKNYGGPLQLTPHADLLSSEFAICLFQSVNRWRYLQYLRKALGGEHATLTDVYLLKGRIVQASGSARTRVQLDGEIAGGLPQTFTIQDEALSLIVPPTHSTDLNV